MPSHSFLLKTTTILRDFSEWHGFFLESSPVVSDRNGDLVSAADNLKIFIMFCIWHVIGMLLFIVLDVMY